MTTLSLAAVPERHAILRPMPWRRMGWVSWRQHRIALTGVALLLSALAAYVWITGLKLHHAYATAAACHPASSPACRGLISTFNVGSFLANGYNLQAVPALIGAFVGAPVLARELETGTFRFAWTQGFGRWRWILGKLVPLAVVVTATAGAFSVLLSWYYQPSFAARNPAVFPFPNSTFTATLFDLRGVAFAAWTLAAFAIGCLAGMLIRRVVPAIAATLAAYAGLAFAAGLYLRQHYLTPVVSRNAFGFFFVNPAQSAFLVRQWWTKGGTTPSQATMSEVINSTFSRMMPVVHSSREGAVAAQKPLTNLHVFQYLTQHGYTYWTTYQPASRFWLFQWIEAGWLLALSVLLIAVTVWLVRRRAS